LNTFEAGIEQNKFSPRPLEKNPHQKKNGPPIKLITEKEKKSDFLQGSKKKTQKVGDCRKQGAEGRRTSFKKGKNEVIELLVARGKRGPEPVTSHNLAREGNRRGPRVAQGGKVNNKRTRGSPCRGGG